MWTGIISCELQEHDFDLTGVIFGWHGGGSRYWMNQHLGLLKKRSLALSFMLAQIFHPQETIFSALAFWKAGTIGICHSTKLWNLYFFPPQGILNSQSPDTRVWQASLRFLSGGNECLVSLNIGPFLPPQPKGWHWKGAKKKRKKKKAPIFSRT